MGWNLNESTTWVYIGCYRLFSIGINGLQWTWFVLVVLIMILIFDCHLLNNITGFVMYETFKRVEFIFI